MHAISDYGYTMHMFKVITTRACKMSKALLVLFLFFRKVSSYVGTMIVPCFPTVYTGVFKPAGGAIT